MLRFLHLSDIHFRRELADTSFDIDADLRNELERDLVRCGAGPASGILVTGDIAFSGKAAEYDTARGWLLKLTDLLDASEVDVWVVPGNHDIDRSVIESSPATQRLHDELRLLRGDTLNARLLKALGDPVESAALLDPLSAYNTFAFRFRCQVSSSKLYWEDDLELEDGSALRLRGLTSPLASDRHDNIDGARLFLSDFQTSTIRREDGVEYMTLCHHPFDWLYDSDRARDRLDRAKVRLFGHKHRLCIRTENEGIFLVAGATHPVRDKEWNPRYNVLEVGVATGEGGQRSMKVRIKARVWDDSEGVFKADVDAHGSDTREYEFALQNWRQTGVVPSVAPQAKLLKEAQGDGSPATDNIERRVERPERMLVYRLVSLPPQRQQRIALDLGLIEENEWFREEAELWRAMLTRARESRKLAELWTAVEGSLADGRFKGYKNPFERTQSDEATTT